jgi:hypothetical protein
LSCCIKAHIYSDGGKITVIYFIQKSSPNGTDMMLFGEVYVFT